MITIINVTCNSTGNSSLLTRQINNDILSFSLEVVIRPMKILFRDQHMVDFLILDRILSFATVPKLKLTQERMY